MINWDQVAQLRDEVGADEFGEVVDLFLDEVEQVNQRLRAGGGALQEDLHFLKGSALNLGFEAFGQMCQDGERLAASGQGASVRIEPILACYEDSRRAFLDGIAGRAVA